ncbi:MAG: carbohydrate kinase family protein [Promethearchaeota archaeon]
MNYDVICIGAALIDMVARVERHPLEDDEVFVSDLSLLSGGAAANTAVACAKLGLKTAFIGKLGLNDTFGNKILEDFKKENVSLDFIKYSTEYGTGSAYVALDKKGDRRIYAYSGAANYLSVEDIAEQEILTSKIIYLSSLKNLAPFIAAARIGQSHDLPVILNPGMLIIEQGFEAIRELLEKIDILILSLREFCTLMKLEHEELKDSEIKKTAISSLLSSGMRYVIITMGDKGANVINDANNERVPAAKVPKVVDTTGAGDSFSAGFIYRFSKDMSYEFEKIKKCVEAGNFVAGKCIQEVGARNGLPSKKEVPF